MLRKLRMGHHWLYRMGHIGLNSVTLSFQFVYFILSLMPVVLNYLEENKRKAIHSNM